MREHQIVITLKPEQFQEVQRLARAAGAKSMGIFVRQKLLAVLGIDGALPAAQAGTVVAPNFRRLTGELRRLHGELKTFVAESLVQPYLEEDGAQSRDPAPQVISELPMADDLPSLTPIGLEFPHFAEGDISEEEAASLAEEMVASLEEARDELEQLAQKAFAISPRLGILEMPGDPEDLKKNQLDDQDDPLDDLLGDSLNQKSQPDLSDEEEGGFVVPLKFPEKSSAMNNSQSAPQETAVSPPATPSQPSSGTAGGQSGSTFSGGPPPRRRHS